MLKKLLLFFGVFISGIFVLNAYGNFEGRRSAKAKKTVSTQNSDTVETTHSETLNPYTAIPDPNFEAALSAYDDIPNDGQVPTNNINGITNLNVNGSNISTLIGIEDFTALQYLDLDNNSLDSLNVSNNTALIRLRLRLNNVSNIDLSNNINLRVLSIGDNGLERLDISNNVNLEDLFVGGNSLTDLDLSNNPNLETVGVNTNNLVNLNIQNGNNANITTFVAGNNPDLNCILVDNVSYSNANWTSIDPQVSFNEVECDNYTAIPDSNFEARLEALGYDNISGDGQVPKVYIENVTSLDVSNRGISNLIGIQDFTALEYLDFNNNNVDSLNVLNNTALRILRLRNNNVNTIDISNNTNLINLLIENNGLERLDVSNNVNLEQLYLAGNVLTDLDLSNNPNLEILGVNTNNLVNLNIQNGNNTNITTFVAVNNPDLNCILVDNVGYSNANWTSIDPQVSFNDVECNNYTAIPDPNFEAALESLGYDNISGDGQVPTVFIESVTGLNLFNRNISDLTGIEAFTALTNLNCERNNLTSLDLQYNTNLQILNCGLNLITALDLQHNTVLENLNCARNSIPSLDLQYNTVLRSVNCERNSMTMLNISNNPALEALDCERNSIGAIDITNNSLLETLVIRLNPISELNLSQNTALRIYIGDGTRINTLNFNTNVLLETVVVRSNDITEINIKNQNNTNITNFDASNSPNLTCIAVDDVSYSIDNWTQVNNATVFTSTFCNYTAIPDANFEAALNALGYDDIAADGQVPTSLIEGLTSLDVSNQLIMDLTGIEDFTALETLNANSNSLTTVDLSANIALRSISIRENTLASLDVTNNSNLETIAIQDNNVSSLDLSNNTALNYLGIARNSLATIDVSNNINLSELFAGSNALTGTIDLSNNPNLTVVGLNGNNITYLDVRNGFNTAITTFTTAENPNLYCIQVDDADYSTTNWTAIDTQTFFSDIDTSCYTSIPDPDFEAALGDLGYDDIPGDGQVPKGFIAGVTVLNVINKSIEDLSGIEDFTSLTDLRIAANPITEIDLTNNTALEALDAANCDISTINITGLTQLRNLYIQLNELPSLDLSAFPNLENLDVSNNLLTALNIRNGNSTTLLTMNARNNDNLTCIFIDNLSDVNSTWFKDDQASYTETDYCGYTSIPDTNFEGRLNDLGYDDIVGDGQVPTDLISTINSLNIASNNISDLTGIQDFRALQVFDASNNPATSIAIDSLTQLLELNLSNTGLDSLNTDRNTLLKILRVDESSIKSLDITNNEELILLNADDIGVLANVTFGNNSFLRELILSGNQLTSIDLSTFPQLRTVRLNNNNFTTINLKNGNNGIITDFTAVGNPSLTCILVDNATAFTNSWGTVVGNANISDTFCDYTTITDPNFEAVLNTLGYDDISGDGQVPTPLITPVTSLNVSNQAITDLTGIQDFINLQTLNVSDNTITEIPTSSLTQLVTLQANNNSLNTLNVSSNTSLERLLVENNNLSSLNLQNATLLEELSANDNNLNSISLNNNTALERVSLSNNMLTALDVTSLTNLIELQADSNAIPVLALDANVNLEFLSINNNQLSTIDLSNNTLLDNFSAQNNQLTSIDLSNNGNLRTIRLNNNNLTAANVRNGNNTNILIFSIIGNSGLTCVLVDDAAYSTTNWTLVDSQVQFTSTDYCEYTTILDNNFETRLRQLGYDDIPNDGRVPTALISTVTNLNLFNRSISDLTGIEGFAALQTLVVDQNGLSSLNLSANSQLRDVSASNNVLTSVNFGVNTNLEEVQLNNNNLSSLSLTGLTNIAFLNLNSNPLNSLDLTDQGALQELFLNSNPYLTSVNLTNKTALREAYLRNSTVLSSITFGNNPMLRTVALSGAAITEIDITMLTALRSLEIDNTALTDVDVSQNTSLRDINASDTAITSLDLSANTSLDNIILENTVLSFLNVQNGNNTNINNNAFRIGNNPNLFCVVVDDATYSTNTWTNVDPQVAFSDTFCRYTTIPDANFEARLEALGYDDISGDGQVPTALIEVVTSLDVENITVSNIIQDLTGIEAFAALQHLNINANDVDSLDLRSNSNLITLTSTANGLQSIDVTGLTQLEELNCGFNLLTELVVATNENLRKLDCRENNIGTLNVSMLPLLTDVNCSFNSLTEVNIQNGNNVNFTNFNAATNPNLTCILVDDVTFAQTNFTNVDAGVNFSDTDYCNYTAVPDVNFEARLEALGYDDISGDGQVPTALIEGVTSLDIESVSSVTAIQNLTGIEAFTALQYLNMRNNNVSDLDLRSNTNLITLICDSSSIDTINLTDLTQLQELDCKFNSFQTINLSTNTNLQKLDCRDSGLNELDVSMLPLLTDLDCRLNLFTELNIRNGNNVNFINFDARDNANLTCIFVDDVAYATANFTNVDATASFIGTDYCNYTTIPDANFEARLEALGYDDISGDGQVPTDLIATVTNLDVRNQSINDLTGIEDFTALTYLDCQNNSITTLNLQNNTALTTVVAKFNFIDSLNIQNNALLEVIDLQNNRLASVDVTNNSALRILDLERNRLTTTVDVSNNTALTGLVLKFNTLITELDVSQNTALRVLLCNTTRIDSLDLSNNTQLTDIQAQDNNRLTFIDVSNAVNLRDLKIFNTPLTAVDVTDCAALEGIDVSFTNITSLDLSNNPLMIKLVAHDTNNLVSINLTNTANLEELKVYNCNLTALDVSDCTALKILEAYNADITELNLVSNPNLEVVNVSSNDFTTFTIKNGNNTAITSFDASNNPSLTCLEVDDVAYSNANWTNIDPQTVFTEFCRYTAIPDAAFEAELEASGLDDISADGQVPTSLIENATSLNIGSVGVTDLTGIEAFTALENLKINTNTITTVNLSSNTNLRIVEFEDTTINNLVLDNNPLLESIEFEGAGQSVITDLDLSNSPLLQRVDINYVGLVNLTLPTQLPNLEILFIAGNNFASFDASGYPALRRISFSDNPNLSIFDFRNGNNTNILSANLLNLPNLTCMLVDDVAYATANFTNRDPQITFNEVDCVMPTISCPEDVIISNDPGICGASITIPMPTVIDDNTGCVQNDDLESYSEGLLLGQGGDWDTWNPGTTSESGNITTEQARSGTKSLKIEGVATGGPQDMVYKLGEKSFGSWELTYHLYVPSGNSAYSNVQKTEIAGTETASQIYYHSDGTGLFNVSGRLIPFNYPQDTWFEVKILANIDGDYGEISVDGTFVASHPFSDRNSGPVGVSTLGSVTFYPGTRSESDPNPNATPLFYVDDLSLCPVAVNDYNNTTDASDVYPVGNTLVDWTFTDIVGNVATCTQQIIVNDTQAPEVTNCPSDVTVNTCNATVNYEVPLALDNCDVAAITGFIYLGKLGNKAYYLSEAAFNAPDAFIDAEAQNGFVATIDSQELNELLTETTNAAGTGSVIIGLTDAADETVFSWHNGSTSDYTNWNDNEPNDFQDNEDYVELRSNGRWNDINATSARRYVLELSGLPMTQTAGLPSGSDFPVGTTTNTFEATDSEGNTITCSFDVTVEACTAFSLDVKVFLQGAALNPNTGEENLMRDDLRVSGMIPVRSPYDNAEAAPTAFDATGHDAIVDWVWVELRDKNDPTIVVEGRSYLLQRDGDIVARDGVSSLFYEVTDNTYYIAVKHRNHLGIMSNAALTFTATNSVDFTNSSAVVTFGNNAQTTSGMPSGVAAMWCGNANNDTVIQYSGTSPDTPNILSVVLNDPSNFLNFPTFSVTGYNANDINMDGVIQYSGTSPDTPFILQNVLAHPGNFLNFSTYQIVEQLPENVSTVIN